MWGKNRIAYVLYLLGCKHAVFHASDGARSLQIFQPPQSGLETQLSPYKSHVNFDYS